MTTCDKVVDITKAMGWQLVGSLWILPDGTTVSDGDWQPNCSLDQLRIIETWLADHNMLDHYVAELTRGYLELFGADSISNYFTMLSVSQKWAAICELFRQ